MVGLLRLDELAEVFQCQLHTSSGSTIKGDRFIYWGRYAAAYK